MKFEDVLPHLDINKFDELSNEELAEIVQKLRAIRTDVPETKHRRRKVRSREHLAKQLLEMSKKFGVSVEELMENPDILAVLAGGDDEEEENGE